MLELVYLWVEDYKNIYEQGFNFSPRFDCSYENDVLTIIDKEETGEPYIKDFFGENINVTAIVGKNGSGKSSLLEIFEKLISFSQVDVKKNYLLIYYFDNELRYFSNIKFKCNMSIHKNGSVDFNGFMSFVARLPYPMFDRKKYHPESITYDSQYSFFKTVTFDSQKIAKMIAYTFRNDISVENNLFDFIPNVLEIKVIHELEKLPMFEDEIKKLYMENNEYKDKSKNALTQGSEDIFNEVGDLLDEDLSEFSSYDLLNPDPDDIFENYLKNLVVINKLQDTFLECNEVLSIVDDTNGNIVKLDSFLKKHKLKHYPYKCDYQTFRSLIGKEVNIKDLSDDEIELYFGNYYELLNFEFIDENNRNLYSLSHGEQTVFFLLLNLILKIKSTENNIFIFDELEISLHPNWQKKILNELIVSLNKLDKKMHFLFISHSPFLLSDIPKQNIVFLDTYSEKDQEVKIGMQKINNCKVLSHDEVLDKKQTFGANIHTLLSDSFFMEDGLMGEFAKGKINEIINFHKEVEMKDAKLEKLEKEYEDKRDKFYQTQSIVGEEYLKQILDNHLMEIDKILLGKKRAKESKKERLRAELAKLEDD